MLGSACRRPDGDHGRQAAGSHTQPLTPDTAFGEQKQLRVLEIVYRHAIRLPGGEIAGWESQEVTALRRRWQERHVITSRILLHPRQPYRLAWQLPAQATPTGSGHRLMLVLQPASNLAALVDHRRRQFRADTPARVAAWLEGVLRPAPVATRLEVFSRVLRPVPGNPAELAGLPPDLLRRIHGLLVPPSRAGHKPPGQRYAVTAWSLDGNAISSGGQSLLWDLALLPLIDRTGSDVLAPLGRGRNWPLRVGLARIPGAARAGHQPPERWLSLDLLGRRERTVRATLLRLPPPGYKRVFGPLVHKDGRVLFPGQAKGLRARRVGEPRKGALTVHNPQDRALFVYADGVLLGCVGPRARTRFSTLPPGYYRIVALSLLGTTGAGPVDLYVPGKITLKAP